MQNPAGVKHLKPVIQSETFHSNSQSCQAGQSGNRGVGLLGGGRWGAEVRPSEKQPRCWSENQPLWTLSSLLGFTFCILLLQKFSPVQETGYSSNGQENEALGEVSCNKGMSGTSLCFQNFPVLAGVRLCSHRGPCQRDWLLNAEHEGDSPLVGMCAVEGKSQKRVQEMSAPKILPRHEDLAWDGIGVFWPALKGGGDKACHLAFFNNVLCIASVSQYTGKMLGK